MILVPMRTVPGQNAREHWRPKAKRVKAEREAVAWTLAAERIKPPPTPCAVVLTRIAPSGGLDDDNLSGALKAARDEVAKWLGVDDRRIDLVRYLYAQERGRWGVRIEFAKMPAPTNLELLDSF